MSSLLILPRLLCRCSLAFVALIALAGCQSAGSLPPSVTQRPISDPSLSNLLRPNDEVLIKFSGISAAPSEHRERIKEDGIITLPLIGPIKAEGLTTGELEKAIHDKYVPKYYRHLTITIQTEYRLFYVEGEVKAPRGYQHVGETTVMNAITTAGGFTEFANKRKILLIRADGRQLRINYSKAQKNPKLDLPVYPGDTVYVPRRFF